MLGKKYPDNYCIIGEVPAMIVKEDVDWCAERIV